MGEMANTSIKPERERGGEYAGISPPKELIVGGE
jgi:hypothetical protein